MREKTYDLLVCPEEDNQRLDVVLGKCAELPARNACVKLIEEGRVLINGTRVTSKKEKVQLGDRILVTYEVEDENQTPYYMMPNPIPLDIRYEDKDVIVLSKQTGLVCHPSPGHIDDTLANALVARYGYENLCHMQGEDRPGIVHRLDMDTTGLMLAAHTDKAQEGLQDLIRSRTLDRRYLALVHGYMTQDEGSIVAPIARSRKNRLMMAVNDCGSARDALTTYKTLARFKPGYRDNGYTLVECHLFTGRTHQIRVHMRHIAHPLVGDPLYGYGNEKSNRNLSRQFLHSWFVRFPHPITGETIQVKDRLPEDLHQVLVDLMPSMMNLTPYGCDILDQIGFGDQLDRP